MQSVFSKSLLIAVVIGTAGCVSTAQRTLGMMSGTVNDPSSRTFRREILAQGLSDVCHQVMVHDVPLRMSDDAPIIGRMYPTQCSFRDLQNGHVVMGIEALGYAWTSLSKKSSFSTSVQVEYDADFRMSDSTMYVYFRAKQILASQFHTIVIEQGLASLVNQLTDIGDRFGRELLAKRLAGGFTVISEPSGEADISLGFVELGKRPSHPFTVDASSRITVENFRTEVHQNERDIVGPIEVTDDDAALFISAQVEGLPIDVQIYNKQGGEALVRDTVHQNSSAQPAVPPVLSDVAQPGAAYKRTVPVAKGIYFLVFDNTPSSGAVAPSMNPLEDRSATVNYLVQVGSKN